MFDNFPIVKGMASLRCMSGFIEISAAMLMLYFGRVETAVKINSILAIIGPIVLITVTTLGLIGVASKVSMNNFLIIICGIIFIFYGLKGL